MFWKRGGMVYTEDLKSSAARLMGSSPFASTNFDMERFIMSNSDNCKFCGKHCGTSETYSFFECRQYVIAKKIDQYKLLESLGVEMCIKNMRDDSPIMVTANEVIELIKRMKK